MNINRKPPASPDADLPAVTRVPQAADSRAAGAAAQKNRVELSMHARAIRAAHRTIKQLPDVDAQKVNRIKAEFAAGTYRVKSHTAASQMLLESLLNDLE